MFNTPKIVVTVVDKFISDEIHITNKQSGNPSAILTFVPVDEQGERIASGPVAVAELKGEAFNYWYENWNGETALYSTLLNCLKLGKKGISLTGVDLSKLGSLDNLSISEANEVLAPPVTDEITVPIVE